MKSIFRIVLFPIRLLFWPIFFIRYKKRLPNFSKDFPGKRVYMISELPGGSKTWEGQKRRKANLGNTHPWNRYFNRNLNTKPKTLSEIEVFLSKCKYVSDRKTRSQDDFWEPPDVFEKRRTGDCEDHAIWAWRHLHDLGFKCRLVIGQYNTCHAWVHIFNNGRAYLLEATQKHKWFPNPKSYKPWWSVENVGNKKFAFFAHGNEQSTGLDKCTPESVETEANF